MFDYGKAGIEEIVEAMYNYYDVQCIAEGLVTIEKTLFKSSVIKAYNYYLDNAESFLLEDKILRVILNKKKDKPFFCIDIEAAEDGNVEILLIVEPEVENG